MARLTTPLTNTQIEKAKSSDKEYNLADGKGLYLRIKPTGLKIWLFNYYHPLTEKRTNLSIGRYPEISLAQAREARNEFLALLARKIDPKAYYEQQKQEQQLSKHRTFLAIAEQWKAKKQGEIELKTLVKYWRSLELHIFPFIGNYLIDEILPTVVIPPIKRVEERNTLDMAQRLCGYINEILNFAVNSGLIAFNPCLKIGKTFKRVSKQNNPRISSEELPDFIQSIEHAHIEPQTKNLIYFQMLTMTRPGEASGAEWGEIDFKTKLWTIPAERMKAREKHIVPLSKQAIAILQRQKEVTGQFKYVFTKYGNNNEPMNPSSANVAIKRMGYQGKQTAHGLRGLARTYLAEQNITHEHAEACLAHKTGGNVSLAYNHSTYLKQRKKIMQLWADYVTKCSTIKAI